MVEAKEKIRVRHSKAIGEYLKWEQTHMDAPPRVKVKKFDQCVDRAANERNS